MLGEPTIPFISGKIGKFISDPQKSLLAPPGGANTLNWQSLTYIIVRMPRQTFLRGQMSPRPCPLFLIYNEDIFLEIDYYGQMKTGLSLSNPVVLLNF